MSEAAPGYQDAPEFATAERARLAAAMRGLIDAVMTTPDADTATLLAVAEDVDELAARLTGGAAGERGPGYRPRSHGDYLPRSPVVGEASPLSPRIDWDYRDGRVRAHGTFTAAYEGPPGFVHGGMVALAFDEVLGIVNIANGSPGMTGTLTVRYRKPTPLHREVRFEAWVESVSGRRIVSRAELWTGETLCAEAEGIFIQPRPEVAQSYFGGAPDGETPFAS
jgi:acyl-coenzyme A thioesterase PaaI-like protein